MIEARDVGKIPPDEVRFLKGQTRTMSTGYLRMYLDFCWNARIKYDKQDFFCDVITDKNRMGSLNCWCIVQDLLYKNDEYLDFGIWTPKAKRGKGHASRMLEWVGERYKDKKLAVWPSNIDVSPYLYRKFDRPPYYAFDGEKWKNDGSTYERFDFSKLEQ